MKGRATHRRFEGARTRCPRRVSRKNSCALLAVAATAAAAPFVSRAGVDNWQVGSGNWSTPGNWTTGVPALADFVSITENDATNRFVTYDYNGAPIVLNSLTIDNTGTGTNTLSQSDFILEVAGHEYVGFQGKGVVNQSGGTHIVGGGLYLANPTNGVSQASGTYNLSGSGALSVIGGEFVAYSGLAVFNQTGGTHQADSLSVGGGSATNSASANGTFNLGGGILKVSTEVVGTLGGTAVFNQSGGTHIVTATLQVGSNSNTNVTSHGTYNLSGGLFQSTQSASNPIFYLYPVTIGDSHAFGTLNVSGGMFDTKSGGISVIDPAGGASGINLSGGTISTAALVMANWSRLTFTGGTLNLTGGDVGSSSNTGNLIVGGSGSNATLNQYFLAGGIPTLTVTTVGVGGNLVLGNSAGSSGTYNLSNSASLNVTGNEYVGNGGIGVFNQTGGTHTIGGVLYVSYTPGSTGTVSLSGGSLTVTGQENIGWAGGSGTFTQTGGTHNALSAIDIGNAGPGTYNLQAGTLNAGAIDIAVNGANATYNQSGGAANAVQVRVGAFGTGGIGIVNLSGGSLGVSGVLLGGFGTSAVAVGILNSTGGSLTASSGITIYNSAIGTNVSSMTINGGGTVSAGFITTPDWARLHFVRGTLNLTGGVSSNPGTLTVGSGSVGGAVLNLSGGSLTAGSTLNNGTFNQAGGVSSLGAVSGTGSLSVGNGPGTTAATMHVSRFAQNSVSIGNNGTILVTPATRVTNTTTALTITGTGLLDLGNHALLVDNTATPESAVRQYLHNAYNADASGIGNWLGKGGITAADAIASHGAGGNFKISVGYVNGAYANDPLIGGSIPGQPTLATNRILVRPALYGDLNLDGKVDDTDLAIFSGLGQYNKPSDKFGWLGGDLNQDGKVDDTDLLIFSGAGNYNGPSYGTAAQASHASATPSLTGHAEGNGDIVLSASTSQGVPGDGVLDFVYDPATGHVTLSYDGDPRVTAAQPFQVVRFKSAGGHFVPANFNQTDFGAGVTATTTALNGTASGSNSVPDGYDMGAVLPTGLTVADLTSDLTLQWNVFGGGLTLKNGDVVVPEPATLGLIGLAASGLLARRRKLKG